MDNLLIWLGIKKGVMLAGVAGGAISGALMPGVLASLNAIWKRLVGGSICGGAISGFGAEPLANALERPDYLIGIALCLGLFGLSFVFKVLKAWNDFDLGNALNKIIETLLGRIK